LAKKPAIKPPVALDDRLITPAELAPLVRRSLKALEAWRARGQGPSFLRISGRILYSMSSVMAFLAESRVEPTRPLRRTSRIIKNPTDVAGVKRRLVTPPRARS
jgi:hypothetical protein